MQTASNEIVKAAFSLIYGTNDLLGRYYIPKGTVFRVTGLLDIYFNSKCYRVR